MSGDGPVISHLFFADDSLIFIRADAAESRALKWILNIYESVSGQSVSFEKFVVCFSPNIVVDRRRYLQSLLGVRVEDNLGTYLGLPSAFTRRRSDDWRFLKDKVWRAMQGWTREFFSVTGKEVLIKCVGQAIPTYAMSVFKISKGCCDELSKMFARFWWGSTKNQKKLHWRSWSKLCFPKELGGLNFRDLEGFNQALLAKQVWRMISFPNLLVARVIKARYAETLSLLEAGMGKKPSYFWRSYIWGRELLAKGLRMRVGKRETITAFGDKWLPRESTFKPITPPGSYSNIRVVDLISEEGEWMVHKLKEIFWPEDVECIRKIPIRTFDGRDIWVWHYDKRGNWI